MFRSLSDGALLTDTRQLALAENYLQEQEHLIAFFRWAIWMYRTFALAWAVLAVVLIVHPGGDRGLAIAYVGFAVCWTGLALLNPLKLRRMRQRLEVRGAAVAESRRSLT